jgi:[protein-PII] uridylyltransferase
MSEASSSTARLADFGATMPARYRESFDPRAIDEHASIVSRRDGSPAHVEVWRRLDDGITVLCVVADDRPGLLSRITASLVIHSMDVVAAQAYTRVSASGSGEAVDLLWVRRMKAGGPPLSDPECARIADVLRALVTGEISVDATVGDIPIAEPRVAFATRVAFSDTPTGPIVMTIETSDRPGLLLAITRALFRSNVQIVASDASTEDGRVVDRFTLLELDGSPIGEKRRRALQTDVLAAVDAVARSSRSSPR